MGWKTQKIRNLQKDAAIESERDCPSIYTQFRIMERRCRRFFLASQTNNSCLPNVDPALLIHDNSIELIEGVILLRGHLSILKQKDLIRVCLELDHPSNLDTHYNIPEKMWEKYRGGKELVIEPKADKKPLTLAKAIRDVRWKILVSFIVTVGQKLQLGDICLRCCFTSNAYNDR
jgi:hypothetical protein